LFSVVGQLASVNLNGPFRQINGQPPDPRDIDVLFIQIDQLIEDVIRDEQEMNDTEEMSEDYSTDEIRYV